MLDKSIELVEKVSGKYPRGYVAPWWELSPVTVDLLVRKKIKYDHSLMHCDFVPYYVRTGDTWTKIDYSKPAAHWMKPLQRGKPTGLPCGLCFDLDPMLASVRNSKEYTELRTEIDHRTAGYRAALKDIL